MTEDETKYKGKKLFGGLGENSDGKVKSCLNMMDSI